MKNQSQIMGGCMSGSSILSGRISIAISKSKLKKFFLHESLKFRAISEGINLYHFGMSLLKKLMIRKIIDNHREVLLKMK